MSIVPLSICYDWVGIKVYYVIARRRTIVCAIYFVCSELLFEWLVVRGSLWWMSAKWAARDYHGNDPIA